GVGISGAITHVRCVFTPGADQAKNSMRDGKVAHAPPCSGKNGSRQPVAPSSQPEPARDSFAKASNFCSRLPVGSVQYLSWAGRSRPLFAERAARTMHTRC